MVFDRDVEAISLKLLERIATPVAVKVAILLRYREYGQIAACSIDPADYLDAERFARDAQAVALLRKYEGMPGQDLHEAALSDFYKGEADCYVANERLSVFFDLTGNPYCPAEERDLWVSVIQPARSIIAKVLGPLPRTIVGKHGPGATFGDKGSKSTLAHKMQTSGTVTRDCDTLINECKSLFWGTLWGRTHATRPKIVKGNRFTSVPKDSTKNRGICIEPSVNLFLQLGIGQTIRNGLRRVGIDLDHGQLLHRQVACTASLSGEKATIDLSRASDTVCKNLVKLLLPSQWYSLLDTLRSRWTFIPDTTGDDGKWVLLEKFSSMGNGFTFELETLIFYALAKVCGDEPLVYGDDIIVGADCAENVIKCLQYFGFTPNKQKSFLEGNFRESCGGDYFLGRAVRPFYLKKVPKNPEDFMVIANGLRRASRAESYDPFFREWYQSAWFATLDRIPRSIRRATGPEELGDLVVHDDKDTWRTRTRHCIRYIQCWRPAKWRRIKWRVFNDEVRLLVSLYAGTTSDAGLIPRDGVAGYKLGWVPYS